MKAFIDRSGCIGCGLCSEICPAVFAMDEDGLAYVHTQPDGDDESVREAADNCPSGVISVSDEK